MVKPLYQKGWRVFNFHFSLQYERYCWVKKERSVDFADEAVVDFYFLLTASILALDSFVDGYFFN